MKQGDSIREQTMQCTSLGIVTVLYNSEAVLPGFFESLSRQKGVAFRLYVVDNSPTDSGARLAKALAEKYNIDADIIFNNANLGVAKGNNQGIISARRDGCQLILLANNDLEFEAPTILASMASHIADSPEPTAVTPKIYYFDGERVIWCAGGRFNKFRATTPHFGEKEKDVGQHDHRTFIEYAPTCFVMFPAHVFDIVGMMDETYFVYYDDTDFMWRMARLGVRLKLLPSLTIRHKVSFSTGGDASEFTLYYGARNRVYFIRKHYDTLSRVSALVFFVLTRIIKGVGSSRAGRHAVLRGLIDGLKIKVERR